MSSTQQGNAALKAVAADTGPKKQGPTIFSLLDNPKVKQGMAAVASRYLPPERMLSLAVKAIRKTPELAQCDPQSVLGAFMTAQGLGLEPNTVQGQAYLIPYRKRRKVGSAWVNTFECNFQIGYQGFITLVHRSPFLKSIEAEAIYAGDHFRQMQGSQTFLEYAKTLGDRGALRGAFSFVRLAEQDGQSALVLTLDDILKIRERSETFRFLRSRLEAVEREGDPKERDRALKLYQETPWIMWEDQMAAKSAIKRHARRLPIASSDPLSSAASIDNRADTNTINMQEMTDPDRVREELSGSSGDGEEMPAIEHQQSEGLEQSGEAFATRERVAVQQQADDSPPASKPAEKPAEKQAPPRDDKEAPPHDDKRAPEPANKTTVRRGSSYADFAEAVKAAKSRDAAIVLLDASRQHLSGAMQKDLLNLINQMHKEA